MTRYEVRNAGVAAPSVDRAAGTSVDRSSGGLRTGATDGPVGAAGSVGASDGAQRYLTFALGGEVYALPIVDVTEIMEYRALTVVPMMPAFLRGVINLRGRVVPVVDMAARFGHGLTEIARRTSIVIVDTPDPAEGAHGTTSIGIMVDAVNKVVHLGEDDIEPPPAFGAGIRADFISGMAKYDGQFIIVLDVSHVLSLDDMVSIGRAAHQSPVPEQAE